MLDLGSGVGAHLVGIVGDTGARARGSGDIGGDAGVGGGEDGRGRAAAGRGLVIDDLPQTAVLEEQMLIGVDLVEAGAELLGDFKGGGGFAAVLDTGIAVAGDADAEIKETRGGAAGGGGDGEAEIRGEDGVGGGGGHVDLDGAAIECEQKWLALCRTSAAGGVEGGGAADQDFTAAGEVYGGGAVSCSDDGVGTDEGLAAGERQGAGDGSGGGLDGADGLLGGERREGTAEKKRKERGRCGDRGHNEARHAGISMPLFWPW